MTHPSKVKGNTFERELVNQAIDSGLEAKRAWGSNGEAIGCHESVDILVNGKKLQAKRRKTIASWLKVNEHQDAVVVREDRGESYVVLSWWEYLDLLKGQKCSDESSYKQ